MRRFKENWKVGRTGCVVTDNPEGYSERTGHTGTDNIEYYGGTLVCESIHKPEQAKLIAAAPDLLNAIQYYFDVLSEVNGENWARKPDHVLKKMLDAVKKATE